MSAQKLLSEAEKLLDKGKAPEAIEKLKQALKAEPLNQLAATRLANVHAGMGDPIAAAKVFSALAARLSEAGKSQVAIAIYKQALEFTPNDVELKVKFAHECESVGKLGDALNQGQAALQFFLRRKKYFDATNLMPLLVRLQSKDDKPKLAWIEIMLYSQAEQKLPHLLVAFCGPPGIASQEFPVGGDPLALSEAAYEGIKRLVYFFPRDPKIAYAVAWAAYRREKFTDCFTFLGESLRREPDFSLSSLLLARIFAERQKLNESLFVYKYLKDRMPADKSVDMVTLNRLVEAFVEKNGWLTFTDGMGADELDAASFLAGFQGRGAQDAEPAERSEEAVAEAPAVGTKSPPAPASSSFGNTETNLPPAEIELSLGEENGGEIEFTGGIRAAAAPLENVPPPRAPIEEAAIPAQAPAPQHVKQAESATPTRADKNDTVEFTSIIKIEGEDPSRLLMVGDLAEGETANPPSDATSEGKLGSLGLGALSDESAQIPVQASEDPPERVDEASPVATNLMPKHGTFNPFAEAALPESSEEAQVAGAGEKTQMFSPMDVLGAANIIAAEIPKVETRTNIPPPPVSQAPPPPPPAQSYSPPVDGPATQLFSPVEAVRAAADSRRSVESAPSIPEMATELPAVAQEIPPAVPLSMSSSDSEATTIMPIPPGFLNMSSTVRDEAAQEPLVEQVVEETPREPIAMPQLRDPGMVFAEPITENDQPSRGGSVEFQPIPQVVASTDTADSVSEVLGAGAESVDLGEDLLEGPTKMIVAPPPAESTMQMLREVQQELEERKEKGPDVETFFRRAERYIAKRNYYLARKALRHALALGADEERVKARLRDIRKIELPNSLYGAVSSDNSSRERAGEVLDRLEQEFDLGDDAEHAAEDELSDKVSDQIEQIFRETDPRTILDFGVGLHEMGLYKQAESVFARIVEEFPPLSFDAYYLAAVSKYSRKDYAGAVSILKMLSGEAGKSELEKIQIYYALGELFEKMRRPESREFFRKVAELDANYRNVRHKLDAKEP